MKISDLTKHIFLKSPFELGSNTAKSNKGRPKRVELEPDPLCFMGWVMVGTQKE